MTNKETRFEIEWAGRAKRKPRNRRVGGIVLGSGDFARIGDDVEKWGAPRMVRGNLLRIIDERRIVLREYVTHKHVVVNPVHCVFSAVQCYNAGPQPWWAGIAMQDNPWKFDPLGIECGGEDEHEA